MKHRSPRLTKKQVRFYRDQGYLVLGPVLDDDALAALRGEDQFAARAVIGLLLLGETARRTRDPGLDRGSQEQHRELDGVGSR
jgi:hypothetical protein